jgi:hypothetical protein
LTSRDQNHLETFIDLEKKYFVKQDNVDGTLINLVGEFDPDYLQSFVEKNMAMGNKVEAASGMMENSLPDVPSMSAPINDSLLPHDDPNYKPPEA